MKAASLSGDVEAEQTRVCRVQGLPSFDPKLSDLPMTRLKRA